MQIFKTILKQNRTTKLLGLAVVLLLAVFALPKSGDQSVGAADVSHVITCDAEGNIPLTAIKYGIGTWVVGSISGGTATITNATNCNLPVSLASYKMYDRQLGTQKLYDASSVVNVPSGGTRTLNVALPDCMAQIDVYYGEPLLTLDNANSGSYKTLFWNFHLNSGVGLEGAEGPFCSDNPGSLIIEKTAPTTTSRDSQITYGLKVTNNGQRKINSFTLFDNVEDKLTYVSSSPAGCILTASGFPRGTVKCENFTGLNIGESITYTLIFKVDANAPCDYIIQNKADIKSPEAPDNWSNMVSTKVVCETPNLICTPSSQTVVLDEVASFSATGGTGVYVWTATDGNPMSGNGSNFATRYNTVGEKTVVVTSGTKTATCKVVIEDKKYCELEIVKSVDKTSLKPGERVVYTLKFKNVGTADCTGNGVKVADILDPKLVYISETHSNNVTAGYKNLPVYDSATRTVYWNAGTLTPGESGEATITAKVVELAACTEVQIPNRGAITSDQYNNLQTWVYSNIVNIKAKSDCIPELVCTPANQSVKIDQTASFVATGGTGTYAWTATGGNPSSGNGNTFSTSYRTTGNKEVKVTSADKTAICRVTITEQPQDLVCVPDTQTVDIDKPAYFVATGGTGTYSWTAAGGNPSSGNGPSFNTRYTSAGSKSVKVTSGSKTATCNVVVRDIELICSPSIQYTKPNTEVTLLATGGNGSYTWYAPGAVMGNASSNQARVSYSTSGTKQVTVYSAGRSDTCQVVVEEQNGSLSINKQVRNVTQNGNFQDQLTGVKSGDVLEYQIVVRNTGNVAVSGVMLKDFLAQTGYLNSLSDISSSMLYTGQFPNQITFNYSLAVGQEIVVKYKYTAAQSIANSVQVCNTATTWATNVNQISDTSCVVGNPGNPSLVLSKKAFNDTKNANAESQPASREDYITYTLTVHNPSNVAANNFVITDDLSGVLPLADMIDLGGGSLSGQVISYPAVNISAGSSVSKTFKVRVKFHLSSNISYQMLNTYGNTVKIIINPPVKQTPPKTGGSKDLFAGLGFAALLTAGFALQKRRKIFGKA